MNAFYLSEDFEECSSFHVNSHCIKLIVESAQMLSTAHRVFGYDAPYKSTHKNHPMSIFCRASRSNYIWMFKYGLSLCNEYTYRYGKIHKTQSKLEWLKNNIPSEIPDLGMTKFPLCMPDYCKLNDPVLSYRNYYNQEKRHLFKWKKRGVPLFVE